MAKLLIIGGTGDARYLARKLVMLYGDALIVVTTRLGLVSPAGPVAGRVRQGHFGGVSGLVAYLEKEQIDWVIDASHPFAQTMSYNTYQACCQAGCDYLRLERPAWRLPPTQKQTSYKEMVALCQALPSDMRRIFLTLGTRGVDQFVSIYREWQQSVPSRFPGREWLIRVACPPPLTRLAQWKKALGNPVSVRALHWAHRPYTRQGKNLFSILVQKGPFTLGQEAVLLRRFHIDAVIAKMSGGRATLPKLIAARRLGVQCFLLTRPDYQFGDQVAGIEAALDWLRQRFSLQYPQARPERLEKKRSGTGLRTR